jgi:hypothetical protein
MDQDFMERLIAALEAIQMSQEEILYWLRADRRYTRSMLSARLPPEDYLDVYDDEVPTEDQDVEFQKAENRTRRRCMCLTRTKDPELAPQRPHKSGLPCKLCEPAVARKKPTYPMPEGPRPPICPVMDQMNSPGGRRYM